MSLDSQIKKGVFDEWIRLIYNRLEQLNESYIRMREGCIDLVEYIPLSNQQEALSRIQYKNAGFILTYIKNILSSAKPMFKPEDYNKLNAKVNFLDKLHIEGIVKDKVPIKVYEIKRNDVSHTENFRLTPYFSILTREIEKLYEELIGNLQEILFLEGNIRK